MESPLESSRSIRRRTDFLTLPREVRDMIYELALDNSSPIVVWSADVFNDIPLGKSRYNWYSRLDHDRKAITSSVRDLTPNILLCNYDILFEATRIFYRKNIFTFQGLPRLDPNHFLVV